MRTRFIRRSRIGGEGEGKEGWSVVEILDEKGKEHINAVEIAKLLRRGNSTFFYWNWLTTGCLGSFRLGEAKGVGRERGNKRAVVYLRKFIGNIETKKRVALEKYVALIKYAIFAAVTCEKAWMRPNKLCCKKYWLTNFDWNFSLTSETKVDSSRIPFPYFFSF